MPITDYHGNASYVGKVVSTYEDNGYHDSYFYAVVWDDDAKAPRKIETHSTAFSCGKAGASVDATPERQAAYAAWMAAITRRATIKAKLERRAIVHSIARVANVRPSRVGRLRDAYSRPDVREAVEKLVVSRPRMRSKFRASLADQVIDWLKSDNPHYDRPLSPNQLRCL